MDETIGGVGVPGSITGIVMYRSFFGLTHRPFENTPDPRFYFGTPDHGEALAALQYGVTHRRGVTLITGRPGVGKTMVAGMLAASVGDRMRMVTVSHGPQDVRDFFESVCRGVGVRFSSVHSTGEIVERLRATLVASYQDNATMVLVVEDAHRLPVVVLEAISVLCGLENPSSKLMQIVLLAEPSISGVLCEGVLEPLRQAIYCVKNLRPMTRDETGGYIHHRLGCAGLSEANIFSEEAIDLIYRRAGGRARLVNQICDNCLLMAFGASQRQVDGSLVDEVLVQMMTLYLPGEDAMSSGGDALVRRELVAGAASVPVEQLIDASISEGMRESVGKRLRAFDRRFSEIQSRTDELCARVPRGRSGQRVWTGDGVGNLQARMRRLKPLRRTAGNDG